MLFDVSELKVGPIMLDKDCSGREMHSPEAAQPDSCWFVFAVRAHGNNKKWEDGWIWHANVH